MPIPMNDKEKLKHYKTTLTLPPDTTLDQTVKLFCSTL